MVITVTQQKRHIVAEVLLALKYVNLVNEEISCPIGLQVFESFLIKHKYTKTNKQKLVYASLKMASKRLAWICLLRAYLTIELIALAMVCKMCLLSLALFQAIY